MTPLELLQTELDKLEKDFSRAERNMGVIYSDNAIETLVNKIESYKKAIKSLNTNNKMSYTTCNKCGGMCLAHEQPCHFCEVGIANPSLRMYSEADFKKAAKEILKESAKVEMRKMKRITGPNYTPPKKKRKK